MKNIRVALVTNFVQHYRVKAFEMLSNKVDVDFYFYSKGDESYWLPEHGARKSNIREEHLDGFKIAGIQIVPGLLSKLVQGKYDIYLSGIVGRFSLPLTFLTAKMMQKPFILWTGLWHRVDTLAHRLFFPITRFIYRNADALVVYGEHVKRYLVSEGVEEQKIFIAQNAIDNDSYVTELDEEKKSSLRNRLNIPADQKIILYIGRFVPEKGLDLLLRAFATLDRKDATLLFAGTGPLQGELIRLARDLHIESKVIFSGYISPEETCSFYSIAYAFVLPSITTKTFKEPWGLVVNESFAQSVPVLASDCVGAAASGFLEDGVTGMVFPEGNVKILAEKLDVLLNNPELRHQLGKNAKKRLLESGIEKMISGFMEAIRSVAPARDQS